MASRELETAVAWRRALLERIAEAQDIAGARRITAEMMRERSGRALPSVVEIEAADAGGVPAEWVIPPVHAERRTIIYAHGGGWTLGAPEDVREVLARIAWRAQSVGLSLDYRLAPEHPVAAAIDDVVAAYRWLVAEGTDPREIALAGESAGAHLVLCAALALRDAGDVLPGTVVLLSPPTEVKLRGVSPADVHPDAGPSLLEADLAGLPPLVIQAGTGDELLDDCRRLVAKARAAGVHVDYEEYPTMLHQWHGYPYLLDALRATRRLGDVILQRIGPAMAPPSG